MDQSDVIKNEVWFIYDGDCPICNVAANALRIKKAVGNLYLLNARNDNDHPLFQEIKIRNLNLDEGMVIKFNNTYYHGADALHIMGLLGTGRGWFNRMNALLFRSKTLSSLCYPAMRATRNFALKIKGVPRLHNLDS